MAYGADGRDLSALFDPRSVAVLGASDDPSKWGHHVALQLLAVESSRTVHLVNRRGGTVRPCGHRAGAERHAAMGDGRPVLHHEDPEALSLIHI